MFERFTDSARRVVVLAEEEAGKHNHEDIDTGHILAALVGEGEAVAVAAQVLAASGVRLPDVRTEHIRLRSPNDRSHAGHLPFTPKTKKIMELSLREALQLGHNFVGTEHMLLALCRADTGLASTILNALGVDYTDLRKRVLVALQGGTAAAPPAPVADTREWRVGSNYGIHLYAVNRFGGDEPIGTAFSQAVAAQIVAEHALVATPYADNDHQGGSWVVLLGQLTGQVADLQRNLAKLQETP